jgi:hypothetical protein
LRQDTRAEQLTVEGLARLYQAWRAGKLKTSEN